MKISNLVVATAVSISGLLGVVSFAVAYPGYSNPGLPGYVQDKSVFGF